MPRPITSARKLLSISKLRPNLAIVLGTGFGGVAKELSLEAEIPYAQLPGFPVTSVSGHAGKILAGTLAGTPVFVLSGRAHFYEGHPMSVVTLAVRTLAACGVTDLLLTNAAGGVNRKFDPGDFMLVADHINLMGENPLRGMPGTVQFVDLTEAYDSRLRRLLAKAAGAAGLKLREGVYLAVCGPSYETPSEIRAFAKLGADAVGMSTVPEVIAARACGLRVAALSCITNLAAGHSGKPLSHAEVLQTSARTAKMAAQLLKQFARLYAEEH